jgi:hypothetical protein
VEAHSLPWLKVGMCCRIEGTQAAGGKLRRHRHHAGERGGTNPFTHFMDLNEIVQSGQSVVLADSLELFPFFSIIQPY